MLYFVHRLPSGESRAEHNLMRPMYRSTDSAGVGKHLQVGGPGRFLRISHEDGIIKEDWILRDFKT